METTHIRNAGNEYQDTTAEVSDLRLVKNVLLVVYSFIPVAAGADKFLNILTDWTKYLHPAITDITGISAALFMSIAGVIEIAAGIFVIMNHRIGAYIVSAWLAAIALQLIAGGEYLDVAVRDLAMAAGAFCLSRLSESK